MKKSLKALMLSLASLCSTASGFETARSDLVRYHDDDPIGTSIRQMYAQYGIESSNFIIEHAAPGEYSPFATTLHELNRLFGGRGRQQGNDGTMRNVITLSPAIHEDFLQHIATNRPLSPISIFTLLHEGQHALLRHALENIKYQEFQADYQALCLIPTPSLREFQDCCKIRVLQENASGTPPTLLQEIKRLHPTRHQRSRMISAILRHRSCGWQGG